MAGKYHLNQAGQRIDYILDFFNGLPLPSATSFVDYCNDLVNGNHIVEGNKTFTGNLTFNGGINFSTPIYLQNTVSLRATNDHGLQVMDETSHNPLLYTTIDFFQTHTLKPINSNDDIGAQNAYWRNLYLSGYLIGNSSSITVDQLFNMYTNYLSRSAGPGNYLTGTLFSSVNDINFVGTQGRIGFRAYKTGTTDNAGQMLITSDGTVDGSYRLSIQAWNNSTNGYNTLRMGDSEGLTYKIGENILFHVNDNGRITIGSDPVDNLDVATKQYVDNQNIDLIETTWSGLKYLRDNSQLIPGKFYRITDYTCTTTQANTSSAEHTFDIIVRADSINKLNEEASAIRHKNDTYFSSSKIEAWKIWYSLNNDINRFVWAQQYQEEKGYYCYKQSHWDSTNYPFIISDSNQYSRLLGLNNMAVTESPSTSLLWSSSAAVPNISLFPEELRNIFPSSFSQMDEIYIDYVTFNRLKGSSAPSSAYIGFRYNGYYVVFEYHGNWGYSLWNTYRIYPSASSSYTLVGYYPKTNGSYLPDIEYIQTQAPQEEGKGVIYRMIDEFGNDCPYDFKNILFTASGKYTNAYTFSYTSSSTIKDASLLASTKCYNNIMKKDINVNKQKLNFNVFYSTSTTFYCYYNIFDSECTNNTFENNCSYNTFGSGCFSNTFGSGCYTNTFGSNCYNNTFGSSCSSNTFGSNCSNNTFGSNCSYSIFGNNCQHIVFGTRSDLINIPADWYIYNIIDNGCQYLCLNAIETATSSNEVQNIHIHLGVKGTSGSYKTITVNRNLSYETNIVPAGTTTIEV